MRNKSGVFVTIILLVLFFIAFLIRRWNEPAAKEAFDRHPRNLIYTHHALCRMDCRHISKEEIADIMEKGIINLNKSNKSDRPCPTFALQGQTNSGDEIRVIFAQCPSETKVVTCYNLQQDFECHCPGDEKKN